MWRLKLQEHFRRRHHSPLRSVKYSLMRKSFFVILTLVEHSLSFLPKMIFNFLYFHNYAFILDLAEYSIKIHSNRLREIIQWRIRLIFSVSSCISGSFHPKNSKFPTHESPFRMLNFKFTEKAEKTLES